MAFRAFCLTIAGCPWVFTDTPGLPTLTSTSPLWPSPPNVAEGFLARPTNRWMERGRPLEGDLDVDAQRFILHDAKASADGATHNLLSWLATRDAQHVVSTPLAADLSATALSCDVGDASALTVPGYAWIEGEAVEVASAAGNTLTLSARGALGTKAVAHRIDPAQGLYPEVFATFPWVSRRKVGLWSVDAAGVCTLLWLGYATRAPALADDGARFDLACDHVWTTQRQNPVGGSLGSTRAVGYGTTATGGFESLLLATPFTMTIGGAVRRGSPRSAGPFRDWASLARHHETAFAAATTTAGARINLAILRSGRDVRLDADVLTATVPLFTLAPVFAGASLPRLVSEARGARQTISAPITDVPSCVYIMTWGGSTTLLVSGLDALPTTWATSTTVDGAYTTAETPALRCQHSERYQLVLTDVTATDAGALGPRVSGRVNILPRKPGLEMGPADAVPVLRDPPPFQVIYRVRADHWVYGLRASVINLCEDAHPDDWDWSGIDDVAEASAGLRVARDWLFDGRRTLGEVVTECALLHGCSPVVRAGRLALHAWGWPSAHTTPAVTLLEADLIGTPTWSRWDAGLANRLQLRSPDLSIDASQTQSRARYGPGRQIKVDLAGLDDQASPLGDPLDFARSVVGRLELWGEPLAVVRTKVSGAHLTALELGRELTASEWMLPDGAGGRGLSATRAVVVAREVDLGTASLTVEALVFGRYAYPYAPCGRVASQISTTVLELATAYVGGTTTYSGGNDAATFTVGDKVDVLSREVSPVTDAGQTIVAINTGTRRITLASPLSAGIQARIAAGAIVDVRFAAYGTPVVAGQRQWMFVGDASTRVIDGTTDAARGIAP